MNGLKLTLAAALLATTSLEMATASPFVKAPYGDKLDRAAANEWWKVAKDAREGKVGGKRHPAGSKTMTGRHFLDLEVPRDEVVAFACEGLALNPQSNLSYRVAHDQESCLEPDSVDVITATLVCRHMNESELIDFLGRAYRAARQAVVLNDLHRHPVAHGLFRLVAPVCFRNRLIQHDGALSVRKSFTRNDWLDAFSAAGIPREDCRVEWHWAFRWIVTMSRST